MNNISMLKRFAGWPGPVGCILVTCAIFIGATCVVGFADEPTSQPKPFEQCTPSELAVLAGQLWLAGPQGRPQFEALAEYVRNAYMAAPATGGSGLPRWREWAAVVGEVAGQFSTADREQIASEIENGIPAIPGGVVGLSHSEVRDLSHAIYAVGHRNTGRSIAAAWVNGSDKYRTVPLDELVTLLPRLENMPKEMQAQRDQAMGRLAERVAAEVFAGPSQLKACSERTWCLFTVHLAHAGAVSDERRASWSGMLRQAFAASDEQVQQTEAGRMWRLGRALNALKDENFRTLLVDWTTKNATKWQSMSTIQMQWLIEQLQQAGDSVAQQQLLRVMDYVSAGLLADNLKARSISLGAWQGFSASAAKVLPASQKAQWADRLKQVFLNDPEGLGSLRSPSDVNALATALGSLGDPQAKTTCATFAERTSAWQSWGAADVNLDVQIWLIGVLAAPDKREATKPARLKILERVTAAYMPTNEEAKKVPPQQWASLVAGLYDVMTEETSTLWAERLKGVFDSAAMASLGADAKQRRALLPVIAILDEKMKTGLALNWLKDKELWAGSSIDALASLAKAAYRDDPDQTRPILEDLHKHCVARHAKQPLTLDECLAVKGLFLRVGQRPRAQLWVQVGCDVTIGTEALRAAADQSTLVKLSLALVDTGLAGPDKDTTKFAAAIASVASRGELNFGAAWVPKCMGEALGTPAARQVVREALLDAAGNPRLGVAKILANAYKTYGDFKAWQGYVGQQLSVAQAGKDRKALWHLVQGFTRSVAPKSDDILQIRPGVTAALANAETDHVRITAWQELANMYVGINRPGVASRMLESVKGQFTGDELASIEALQKDLEKKEAVRLSRSGPR